MSELFTYRPADLDMARPVRFLWRPWLVRGKLNLLVGEENAGKSTLQAWITSELTNGRMELDNPRVLYVPADEDDWHEVMTPRLYAHGAKLANVFEFTPTNDAAVFNIVEHIGELDRVLVEGRFHLAVFEQLMDVMPRLKNPNDPMEVRHATRPLRRMLARLGVTGLGTLHRNKARGETLRQVMQGSIQFGALSRSTTLVDQHPTDEGRRIAVLASANYTGEHPAMSFAIASDKFDVNGRAFDVGKVVDVETEELSVADVLAAGRDRARVVDSLAGDLVAVLTGEPQRLTDLAELVGRGPKDGTVRRALEELAEMGLSERVGRGLWRKCQVPTPKDLALGTSHEQAVLPGVADGSNGSVGTSRNELEDRLAAMDEANRTRPERAAAEDDDDDWRNR